MRASTCGDALLMSGTASRIAFMSRAVRVLVAPVPVRTPWTLRLPASTQTKLSPRFWSCSRIRLDPPSPIATVQITAAMPMVMPSIVSAVRNLLRASAERATGRMEERSMRAATAPAYRPGSDNLADRVFPAKPEPPEPGARPRGRGDHPARLRGAGPEEPVREAALRFRRGQARAHHGGRRGH